MKYGRLVIFTLALLGIAVISASVWRGNAGENKNKQNVTRILSINNLTMTLEGVRFDDLNSKAVSDWEKTTSRHIKSFYYVHRNFGIDVIEAITSVTDTGDSYAEYDQKFQIQRESDDETSVEDIAKVPFGDMYDGKELYTRALQILGGVFENVTASDDISINFVTRQPSKTPSSSPIPSWMPSQIPS